ncbi:MAG: type II secretion system protein [Gemmatimonadaceae bacterium]
MPRHSVTRRRGFTLAELLVVTVLAAIVVGGIMSLVVRQQRFYRDSAEAMSVRGQLREAAAILPIELRSIDPRDADIYAWSDSSIEFRSAVGVSAVCVERAANEIVLVPLSLVRGNTLSSWIETPQSGDSILVLDDGGDMGSADDRWRAYGIAAVAGEPAGCPLSSGFTTIADAQQPALRLTLTRSLAPGIGTGSAVRIFRRTHYSLYRSGDSRWYMGAFDCMEGGGRSIPCATIQPVSGPFRPYAAGRAGGSGLRFVYFDTAGVELDPASADAGRIARIDVTIRAEARTAANRGAGAGPGRGDSVAFAIALRNRS